MVGHLRDCLLHLDHHELGSDCYERIAEFYKHHIVTLDRSLVWTKELYLLEYEQKLVEAHLRGGEA